MSDHTSGPLEAAGFDAARRAEFERLGPHLEPGRIARIDRGAALVLTELGERRVRLAREADLAVGDFVALDGTSVRHVLKRRGAVARIVGHRFDIVQVVAANVDLVLVVRPLDLPSSARRVQSLVNLAHEAGATPVVLLTKSDLVDDTSEFVADVLDAAPGVEVLAVSAVTGEGTEELEDLAEGRTIVLLGESGGGKSTLVNLLLGRDEMATAATRGDGQGRHTTTRRELHPLPRGGAIIDTPGVREVVGALSTEQVGDSFAEVTSLAGSCRFSDCSHGQEPGCAIAVALADGTLSAARFDAYLAALRDAAFNERRASKELLAARRRSYRALERQRRRDRWD